MGFFEYTTYFGVFDSDESDRRDDDPLRNWKCWSCKVERLMMLIVLMMGVAGSVYVIAQYGVDTL